MYKTDGTNRMTSAASLNGFTSPISACSESLNPFHNPDQLVIDQVCGHYHQALKLRPELIELLMSRKIDPDFVERFNLGVSDRTLGFELHSPKTEAGIRNRGHLQRLGILKPTGHEFLQGAMVFPFLNDKGDIGGAYGRRPQHQSRSPVYHLYWNAPRVSFFGVEDRLPEELILCKSAIDAMTCMTAGIPNVVATMGVKGLNDIQMSRLMADRVQRVYIAFDNSPEANRYAQLVAQTLEAVSVTSYRVELPLGQDINHLAMRCSDAGTELNRLFDTATPLKSQCLSAGIESTDWLSDFKTVEDCVGFYLDEQRNAGKSERTLKTARIHLDRFLAFCAIDDLDLIADVNTQVLNRYTDYLMSDKNIFTGQVISKQTQMERVETLFRMLSRLHYYGIIPESLSFVSHKGTLQ